MLATDFGLLLESFDATLTFPLGTWERTFVHPELVARGTTAIEMVEEVEDPVPASLRGEAFDYKFTLRVEFVGAGPMDAPKVRTGGREYGCRMSTGQEYWFYLDQALDEDAELVVAYVSRTVAL
jgi:hypothetical protein